MDAHGDMELTIGKGDKANLPSEIRDAIGDRPFISLELKIDGEAVEWNNPSAPVTVTIAYMTNCRYDADKGQVILEVTHFIYPIGLCDHFSS